jgi:hypothetical protein
VCLRHPNDETFRRGDVPYLSKSFSCNIYEPPRKCCKQEAYVIANSFRCSTYKIPGGMPLAAGFQLGPMIAEGNTYLQQAQRIHIHQHRRIGDFFRVAIGQRAAEQFRQYRALRRLQQELEPVLFF